MQKAPKLKIGDGAGGISIDGGGASTVSLNLIRGNFGSRGSAIYYNGSGTISNNTITGNTVTGTGDASSTLYYIYGTPAINNNIYGNTGDYALANGNTQGAPNLDALNNWWGTTNASDISRRIYDFFDNGTRGIVYFNPYLLAPAPDPPPNPDSAPIANAGRDQEAYIGEVVGLNGRDSLDPLGRALT